MLNEWPQNVVFFNVNREIEVFQNMHSFIALGALRDNHKKAIEGAKLWLHGNRHVLFERLMLLFLVLLLAHIRIDLVADADIFVRAWNQSACFPLEFLHSLDVDVLVVVVADV